MGFNYDCRCLKCGEMFGSVDACDDVFCPNCRKEYKEEKVEKSILKEGEELINGARQAQYGDSIKNWNETADIASALTGRILSARDCLLVLVATKLARERNQHKRDNLVDAVAYLELYNRQTEKEVLV